MPACTNCGALIESQHKFCGSCGRSVAPAPAPAFTPQPPGAADDSTVLPYILSPRRVLVMTVLSYGLYLFYWFYLTWRQHRDHTGGLGFPVWHALTLLLPVYGLFRTHAHIRAFRDLMARAGLPCTLSPGWSVALVMVYSALGWASFQVSGGFQPLTPAESITSATARNVALIDGISILVVAGLLVSIQSNLNRYWASLTGMRAVSPRVAPGEVAFALLGVLFWITTIAGLLASGA
ncbi:MAG: zinc ribbon domain-containing protein [Dehalococcoidia bacterium]|nr:zinc ribbon domain-containing protein [Dehalococcoidia bacterium]